MSLVYDFHFNDTRLAGKSATVVDTATGTEVSGSPLTLDASGNGSLTLAEKSTYLATTSNANLGIANARQNGQPNLPASIAAGGGGGSTTDGLGAYFYGGVGLAIPLDRTRVYCPFTLGAITDRSPQRDDLMVIDGDDDTKINVNKSGLYEVTFNTPLRLADDFAVTDPQEIICDVQLDVNDGNEQPANSFNHRAYWDVTSGSSATTTAPISLTLTHRQVLLAEDVVRLAFRVTGNDGLGDPATGHLTLNPDITFILTWLGDLPA